MYRRFSALALLLCCSLCAAQTPDSGRNLHWVGTWGAAQQLAAETLPVWVVPPPRAPGEPPPPPLLPPYPSSFHDETVRMVVRTSVGDLLLRQLEGRQRVLGRVTRCAPMGDHRPGREVEQRVHGA